MNGGTPDSAGIMRALARIPGRPSAERAQDRTSAEILTAARRMSDARRDDPANQHAAWITTPRRRQPSRRGPCCDHRGRYGHRGEAMRFAPCPVREAAS